MREVAITAARTIRIVSSVFRWGLLALLVLAAALLWGHERVGVGDAVGDANRVDAGHLHTCAVTTDYGVKCWGSNLWGQLGNGTTIDSTTPVQVSGLTSGTVVVTAGYEHSCALGTLGGVKCWGINTAGQLGNGGSGTGSCVVTCSTTPVDVTSLTSGVSAVSAGGFHTCALTMDAAVKCWGANFAGQLGDGTTTNRTTPVDVIGLASGIVATSAGHWHTCALTSGGEVMCWGNNTAGQLGDGTMFDRSTPVYVNDLTPNAVAVSAGGGHTCALTSSGGVKCWGYNGHGQLGDGTTTNRTTPVDVIGLTSNVAAISAGFWHTCALTTGGAVKCWGENEYSQLGDGTTTDTTTPVAVTGLASSASVSGGEYHTCVITTSGGGRCWGRNSSGQLGDAQACGSVCTAPVGVIGLEGKPPSVGGIAQLPRTARVPLETGGSTGVSAALVGGITAGVAAGLVVGGGTWYARTRLRRRERVGDSPGQRGD